MNIYLGPALLRALNIVVKLTAELCSTPIAMLGFVGAENKKFWVDYGVESGSNITSEIVFHPAVTSQTDLQVIENTLQDPDFNKHPFVVGAPHIRFYAGIPLFDSQGGGLGVLSILDTVPRKLSEEQLQHLEYLGSVVAAALEDRRECLQVEQSLRSQKAAAELATDGIVIVDARQPDLPITYASRAFCKNSGYLEEEILGRNCRFMQGPNTDRQVVEQIREALLNGKSFQGEILNYRKDGETFWNLLRIEPIYDRRGELSHFVGTQNDITRLKLAEQAVQASELRFRTLYEDTPVMMHSINREGRLVNVSRYWLETLGYERKEVLGRPSTDFLTPNARRYAQQKILPEFMANGYCRDVSYQMVKKNGDIIDVQLSAVGERDENGTIVRSLAVVIDVTQQKRIEAELAAQHELAHVTLESIGDAVITTNAQGFVDYLNPVAETLTGWRLAEAYHKPLDEVFRIVDELTGQPIQSPIEKYLRGDTQGANSINVNRVLLSREDKEYAIEDSVAPILDRTGNILGVVLVFHDVSQQRSLSKAVEHQATHDALTGQLNRLEFERRLERLIQSARENKAEHALCYLDLDQFKIVNDTCGHAAGDDLLRQLSSLLRTKIRARDTLARLGGDEFAVLLEHCSLDQALRVAQGLREAVQEFRFMHGEKRFRIGVSIGLLPIHSATTDVASALQAADSACFAAKDAGRNRVHLHQEHDAMLTQRQGEMKWVSRIEDALESNLFELYGQIIQPIGKDSNSNGMHMELLLRMPNGDSQMSLPGAFMPAAERYHLATRIDQWVVTHAFEWLSARPEFVRQLSLCSINLSGRSVGDSNFHSFVLEEFVRTKMQADKICFEITETAAIANLESATEFIRALQGKGCRFALDDFGSGLSSFAYLKNLPVDFLKIDGAFVRDIVDDPVDHAFVRSINEIGQLMGKKTIAEYVENDAIYQRLQNIGVDYVQGYFLGEPLNLNARYGNYASSLN